MKLTVNQAAMTLQADQYLKLKGARGTRLTCRDGMLWITQEGVLRDDFLAPGCALTIATDGVVLVEAMSASSLHIAPAPDAAGKTPALRLATA